MRITWQQQQLRSTRGGANNQWIAQRESLSLQHCLFGLLKRTLGHKPLNQDVLAPAPRGGAPTPRHTRSTRKELQRRSGGTGTARWTLGRAASAPRQTRCEASRQASKRKRACAA